MLWVRFGYGFLNTRNRPVNPNLYFAGPAVTLCAAFLRICFISGLGLAVSFLASEARQLLASGIARLTTPFYLAGSHFGSRLPLVLQRLNAEVRPEVWVGAGCEALALLCRKHSLMVTSAASSTGGGHMNFSKTSFAAAVMPLVRLLTNSSANIILVCSGGTSAQCLVLQASD